MESLSSLVFRYAPRAITLLAWALAMAGILALLAFAASSLIASAGDPMPGALELAPFRWRSRQGHG